QRKPVLAGLSAAAMVLLFVAAVLAAMGYHARVAADLAGKAQHEAEEHASNLAAKNQFLKDLDENAAEDLKRLKELKKLRDDETGRERAQNRAKEYLAAMREAARLAQDEQFEQMLAILEKWRPQPGEKDLPGWEWHYMQALAARLSLARPEQAAALPDDGLYFTLSGHARAIQRLDWSPDGTRLASYDDKGTIKFWHVTTGKETASLMIDPPPTRRDQTDFARARLFGRDDAWDPQGRRRAIVDGGGIVRIVDAASGRVE